jgi:hypothetical protein
MRQERGVGRFIVNHFRVYVSQSQSELGVVLGWIVIKLDDRVSNDRCGRPRVDV